MEEVWDRLRQATGNDGPLVAFLQKLLSLDPTARADFGTLVAQHPYVQVDQAPMCGPGCVEQSQSSLAEAPATPVPAAVMPSDAALENAVRCIPGVHADRMVPVPGIPFLVFDPSLDPVCETTSGDVYR